MGRRGVLPDQEDESREQQIEREQERERDASGPGDPRGFRLHDLAEDGGRSAAQDPEPDKERTHLPEV